MRKTKLKFNLMDALILLVIAAAVLALLYIFVWSEEHSADTLVGGGTAPVTYVVEVSGLYTDYTDLISVGDKPIDSSTKTPLGTVTAIETRDYLHTGTNLHDGTLVLSPVENYVTMYITIEANAALDGFTYTVNGGKLFVGKLVYLSFKDIVCSGYCIALDTEA